MPFALGAWRLVVGTWYSYLVLVLVHVFSLALVLVLVVVLVVVRVLVLVLVSGTWYSPKDTKLKIITLHNRPGIRISDTGHPPRS